MFALAWRTVMIRVRSDALIIFKPKEIQETPIDKNLSAVRCIALRLREGWNKHASVFAWADKGHWETTEKMDEDTTRSANWFRIGFEPLFVEFTQSGAWFVVFTLAEVGNVGALVPMGLDE